jgi:hypothetical protein
VTDLSITVDDVTVTATWTDDNPDTRVAVAEALPLSGDASRWGDELYFGVPVEVPPENATETVPVGGVAYWPQGNALCLFWGPTPASEGDEPRAASPVNVVARIDDVSSLESVEGDARVEVTRR